MLSRLWSLGVFTVPPLSVLTLVKFEIAPLLSCLRVCATLLAASLVPALFAATVSERGLALPSLGPYLSAAMLSVLIVESEGVAVVFEVAET